MFEAVSNTTALVIAGAVVGAALLVALVLILVRRPSRGGQEELLTLVSEMNERMEAMVRELAESLERAQEEGRRNRYLTELAGSIDLDEVLSRTLEAAGAVPGVDAALVSIDGDEKPLVATLGLSTEEAERQAVSGPPDGHEARAILLTYQYPPALEAAGDLIRSGLAVPVAGEVGTAGFLIVYSRNPEHRFSEDETRSSRSSRSGPGRRSRTRAGSARRGSSPTSTR